MKTSIVIFAAMLLCSQVQAQKKEFMGIKLGLPASAQSPAIQFGELMEGDGYSFSTVYGERICGGSTGTVSYVKGNIEGLMCDYDNSEAPTLLKSLYVKYGEPSRVKQETVQTGMGVKLERHYYTWTLSGMSVILQTPSTKIDTCNLSALTSAQNAGIQANKTNKIKKHAQDF